MQFFLKLRDPEKEFCFAVLQGHMKLLIIKEFNSLYKDQFGFLGRTTFPIHTNLLQLICRIRPGCLCKNGHHSRLERNHSIHH